MPLYLDTSARKATRAIAHMIAVEGAGALPRVLIAMRQSPPADVASLVKLIQSTTGYDMTPDLTAGF